jgi:hypothetical protein
VYRQSIPTPTGDETYEVAYGYNLDGSVWGVDIFIGRWR